MGTVYFYDSNTNAVATANSSPDSLLYADYLFYEAELHAGIGLHGPYNSMAQLDAANPGAKSVANDIGINAVGDFFNQLKEGNLWLRIAEAALGIVLVAVALAKLTGADNYISGAAKTAAKAAVM
jgi:hypothetical protein